MAMLRGELDWVVMKCLEKHRERRYETANGLARDIQRYLADEPVEARPPSAGYRFGKFLKRHKGPVFAASLLLLMLIGGIAGTAFGLIRAESARAAEARRAEGERLAKLEAEVAKEKVMAAQKAEAEQRATAVVERDKAVEAESKSKAINEFLTQDLLVQAEPANNQVVNRVTLQEVLDRAADRVKDRFRDRPEIESSLHWTIGQTYHGLGAYAKAEQHLRTAAEIARRHRAEDDPVTLLAERELVHTEMHLRRYPEALDRLSRVLRLQTRLLGADDRKTLATMNILARVYRETGDFAKAEPLFVKCLEGRRRVLGDDDPETLATMNYLGMLYRDSGHNKQAEHLLVQCLEKRRRVLGPENSYTLQSMNMLGVLYLKKGLHDRAETLLVPCLAARLRVLGAVEPNTLISVRNLAWLCSAQGPNAKSMTPIARFLEADQRGSEHELTETLQAVESMAEFYRISKKPAQAEILLRSVLGIRRGMLGDGSLEVASIQTNLGGVLLDMKNHAAAEAILRESLGVRERILPYDWSRYHTASLLGGSLLGQKKYVEAEPLLVAGYEGMRPREATIPPQGKFNLITALEHLVQLYEATDKPDEATRWRKELEASKAAAKPTEKTP